MIQYGGKTILSTIAVLRIRNYYFRIQILPGGSLRIWIRRIWFYISFGIRIIIFVGKSNFVRWKLCLYHRIFLPRGVILNYKVISYSDPARSLRIQILPVRSFRMGIRNSVPQGTGAMYNRKSWNRYRYVIVRTVLGPYIVYRTGYAVYLNRNGLVLTVRYAVTAAIWIRIGPSLKQNIWATVEKEWRLPKYYEKKILMNHVRVGTVRTQKHSMRVGYGRCCRVFFMHKPVGAWRPAGYCI